MSADLVLRQLSLVAWDRLRAEGGTAREVGVDLRILLQSDDVQAASEAYRRLENPAVSQGSLYECAPAVVSVIMAALAEDSIPPSSLASTLDLLGRILAGVPDPSELAHGLTNLRDLCHQEAMRAFWTLARIALERDPFNAWQVAADVLAVLDESRFRHLVDIDHP